MKNLAYLVLLSAALGAAQSKEYLGEFTNYVHGIAGKVYAVNNKQLFIEGFSYDGTGPDAFFWGGTSDKTDELGILINDEKNSNGPLQPYNKRDITINLPEGLTVENMTWLSVWCKRFAVNFGDLYFSKSTSEKKAATVVEPTIGSLTTIEHRVAGDVEVLDQQTILVKNFKYDGTGKSAYFWADYGEELTAKGQHLGSDLTVQSGDPLPRANGRKDVTVKIPDGRNIYDYTVFGVWSLNEETPYAEIVIPEGLSVPEAKKTERPKLNCEVLDEESAYEIRWIVADNNMLMQLVARVDDNEYMAFGLSGNEEASQMVDGDVIVAWIDENREGHAEDYYLLSKESCGNNKGSCPDTKFGKNNDVKLLRSAVVNGFKMVTVTRPLYKNDEVEDEHMYVDGPQAVIWALGKLNKENLVSYHFGKRNKETLMLDLARNATWNCPEPDTVEESTKPKPKRPVQRPGAIPRPNQGPVVQIATKKPEPKKEIVPWETSKFTCPRGRRFRARIGPSGGKKGYEAITGEVGWGIAWYLNGILLPELTLQRGKTYTFEVEGGNDPKNSAKSHPFYLTNSSIGGYGRANDKQKQNEQILAGAELNEDTGKYEPTAAGRLCEYEPKPNKRAEEYNSFEAYKKDLTLNCEIGRHAELRFRPDRNTPDTIYYQCFTHKRLGFKINIVNSCKGQLPSASILSVKNVSKEQDVDHKVSKPNYVYNSKPQELPRPIVRVRPTEQSQKKGEVKPIVVEEVRRQPAFEAKPPKKTIYVPVKIIPEHELPENIHIHDGSDKEFVFGNPIAVPLGNKLKKNYKPNGGQPIYDYSFQTGFKPLILRDQLSITRPLEGEIQNRPVENKAVAQENTFKPPRPDTSGFQVIQPVKIQGLYNKGQSNGQVTITNDASRPQNVKKPQESSFLDFEYNPVRVNPVRVNPVRERPQFQNRPNSNENQQRHRPRPQFQNRPRPHNVDDQVPQGRPTFDTERRPNRPHGERLPFNPNRGHPHQNRRRPPHQGNRFYQPNANYEEVVRPHEKPQNFQASSSIQLSSEFNPQFNPGQNFRPQEQFVVNRPPINERPPLDYFRPQKPQVEQVPSFPQKGAPQTYENQPNVPQFNNQGRRNSSGYEVLSHVMEYIHEDQRNPGLGHRINKREEPSAEPEPDSKAEPEPPKDAKTSQQKSEGTTASISLLAFVGLIAIVLFV